MGISNQTIGSIPIEAEKKFNMNEELIRIGFELVNKERECLAVKSGCEIYYAVYDGVHFDEEGHPTGMVIEKDGKDVQRGEVPKSQQELHSILKAYGIE